jgi:imidazoleglycerol-phosphate dehydratase
MKTQERISQVKRETKEVRIELELNLDGKGDFSISTGLPFFNHMLSLFSYHSFFDLKLKVVGDLEIDAHHTVEDTGICLGQAIKEALGDKRGIVRYSHIFLPMDEALVFLAVDISNRPFLAFSPAAFFRKKKNIASLGLFTPSLVKEFLKSFTTQAGLTLHLKVVAGEDLHHIIEAIFKGLGQVLHQSTRLLQNKRISSSKGLL